MVVTNRILVFIIYIYIQFIRGVPVNIDLCPIAYMRGLFRQLFINNNKTIRAATTVKSITAASRLQL
jgi:hypothetical protein